MKTFDLDEFKRLEARVSDFAVKRERAIGALASTMKRLQEEFGCASLKQAKAKVKRLEAKTVKLGQLLEHRKRDFLKKYGHLLHEDQSNP